MRPLIEVCVEGVDGLLAAQDGGADRVELCASLLEGGLTPSLGVVREALRRARVPFHVMVRPRGGDFLCSDAEFAAMLLDEAPWTGWTPCARCTSRPAAASPCSAAAACAPPRLAGCAGRPACGNCTSLPAPNSRAPCATATREWPWAGRGWSASTPTRSPIPTWSPAPSAPRQRNRGIAPWSRVLTAPCGPWHWQSSTGERKLRHGSRRNAEGVQQQQGRADRSQDHRQEQDASCRFAQPGTRPSPAFIRAPARAAVTWVTPLPMLRAGQPEKISDRRRTGCASRFTCNAFPLKLPALPITAED